MAPPHLAIIVAGSSEEEDEMAKGQMRKTKEARKPKKETKKTSAAKPSTKS